MIVGFLHSDKPRERLLADAVLSGVLASGDDGWKLPLGGTVDPASADVFCLCGVKSRELFRHLHGHGAHVLYFDKGYVRRYGGSGPAAWEYWRIALDAQQPTAYFMEEPRPAIRWTRLGLKMKPWRAAVVPDDRRAIVIAGSSAKYHAFHGLPDPTAYVAKLVRRLRKTTDRPIVYRPKPSWKEAVPIEGARFSPASESLGDLLNDAWCLITHGSNACIDAVLEGVPCIILGDGLARPISSTELEDVMSPRLAADSERRRFATALAWCQWTRSELASGEMWRAMRPLVLRR